MGSSPVHTSPLGAGGAHALVAERVRETPHACAVREARTGVELTYRQLWDRAGETAALLASAGIGPGALVALDLERGSELIVALLGAVRAGAAYLPIDGHAPADRVTAVLKDSGARAVIVGRGAERRRRPFEADAATPVLTVPTPGDAPIIGGSHPDVRVDEESALCVGYTSGSTGVPKGVVVPHRAVRDLVTEAGFGAVTSADRVGQLANPAFDAFTWEVWGALTAGAPLIVLPSVVEVDLETWTGLLVSESVSTALLTTSLFHMVAREAPAALGTLRELLVGGEQLDLSATLRVLDAGGPRRLVNIYGPTETTVFATAFACTAESLSGRSRIPVGSPVRRASVHILDEELRPVDPGQTGELCVGGPSVTSGYLNQPERTGRTYVRHTAADGSTGTVYRTGDLARQLPDGLFEVVGRADRQVKLRGFRIELEEIEQSAVATGRTEAAFVEKVGEGHTARLVGAFLLPRGAVPGEAPDPAHGLSAALAEQLPPYMLPARWLPLAEIPYGSTGKADRSRIKALLADAQDPAVPAVPAETGAPSGVRPDAEAVDTTAALIAEVWAGLLEVPSASITDSDDFIGLGGNSILATQAAFRLAEQLGVQVDPADVLLAPSLAGLAEQLRAEVPTAEGP
ncbi:non-ribosomal peptide synthetase [Streptomyces sp. H27-H1]|uniref:non-ribosomal peptide synthetase n=1 Tax=Streptomyces sp. H27-H1 TaxID=2996461 RepID=UPI0022721CEB|nr:non-ribosomal peptide synthetase [Streptomyces sp. H27-H1]MCY0927960.1 non-ribosomal peptide synthetase [Streptomyces sp. H27-H1]